MDLKLNSFGYIFDPSRYSPELGHTRLRVVISGKPTGRFFDVKTLHVPTFDGRFMRHTQVSRHELAPVEHFQVCLGEVKLESFGGEGIRAFTIGGNLHTNIEAGDLYCELTSTAPIFHMQADPESISEVIADELMDLVAEMETHLPGHEDELYSRLAKYDPYQVFLACLVSLQKRVESVPLGIKRERFHKASANINRAVKIVQDTDGWDGHSPSLEELITVGGE